MPPPKDDEPGKAPVAKLKSDLKAEAEAFGERLAAGASFTPDSTPKPQNSLEAEAEGAVSSDDFNSAFIRLLMVYTEAKLLQETWLR